MRLIHYSDKFISAVEDRSQEDARIDGSKPNGLWVSVVGKADWPTWCTGEDFALERLTHATEVVLAPSANILHLPKPSDVLAFHRDYRCRPQYGRPDNDPRFDLRAIRWRDIAKKWDGIIIAPYHWELRMSLDVLWYYTWDCASGCIWHAGAVEQLVPRPELGITQAA